MNVVFHITAAIGVTVMLTDTSTANNSIFSGEKIKIGIAGFCAGIISHGALDYIPHCYPVNSKIDIVTGFISILALIFLANRKYRLIIASTCFGSIFPDLVDLGPAMLNQFSGTHLPILPKLFPWHWKQYSGSVYSEDCNVSTINHFLLLIIIGFVFVFRKRDFLAIFGRK